jgi:hypothetical protein
MPRLPDLDTLGTRLTPVNRMGITHDPAAGVVGQAVSQAGNVIGAVADQIHKRVAESHATDAINQYEDFVRTTLYDPQKGYYSTNGKNAADGLGPTEGLLRERQKALADGLKDPMAREAFQRSSSGRLNSSLTTMSTHAQQGLNEWQDGGDQARIASAQQDMALAYNDTDAATRSLGVIESRVADMATRKGWGTEQTMGAIQKASSDGFALVAQRKAQDDPASALTYIDQHADVIDPSTAIVLRGRFKSLVDDQVAGEAANEALGVGGPIPDGNILPKDAKAVFSSGIIPQESGGRNGLISSKGALGVAQVMPKTAEEVCKQLGIPYDAERLRTDPAYCRTIGQAYFAGLWKKYGGNPVLSIAAYNAGPGNVDAWIKQNGDPRTGSISNAQWAAHIPIAETRAYVPGVLRRINGSNSAPVDQPQEHPDEAGALARINSSNLAPDIKEKARAKVISQASTNRRLFNEQQSQTYDSALKVALDPGFKSLSQLPQSVMSGLSGTQLQSLQSIAEHNAKGSEPPPNPDLYFQLSTIAGNRDTQGAFGKMDLRPFATQLPRGDYNHFVDLQRSVQTGDDKAVGYSHIWDVSNEAFQAAGFKDGDPGSSKRAKFATAQSQFMGRMVTDVDAWTKKNGKPPTDADLIKIRDRNLMTLHVDGSDVPLFQVPNGMRSSVAIPVSVRGRIIASYQRNHGGQMPDETTIGNTFLRYKGQMW